MDTTRAGRGTAVDRGPRGNRLILEPILQLQDGSLDKVPGAHCGCERQDDFGHPHGRSRRDEIQGGPDRIDIMTIG